MTIQKFRVIPCSSVSKKNHFYGDANHNFIGQTPVKGLADIQKEDEPDKFWYTICRIYGQA